MVRTRGETNVKVALTLHDACGAAVIRQVAKRYALLSLNARMPSDLVNAPWSGRWHAQREAGGKKSWEAVHREWVAEADRERASYRKTLLSVLDDLPPLPDVELKPYRSPGTGETYRGVYPSKPIGEAADEFADRVLDLVKAADPGFRGP